MKPNRLYLLMLPALLAPGLVPAQTWTQTLALTENWQTVASSADGSKLVAGISSGLIYTSPDQGVTWNSNNVPSANWLAVVSSADGVRLAAIPFNTTPYTSTNSGGHWTTNTPFSNDWHHLASSADGITLVGAGNDGAIAISTNGGGTWLRSSNAPVASWGCIACSADASKVVAMIAPLGGPVGAVYTSIDGGIIWATNTSSTMNKSWQCVSSSADGNTLAAVWGGASVFVSTNAGGTWSSNSVPGEALVSIASSADGTKMVAAGSGSPGAILTSTDSGFTWSTNAFAHAGSWKSVASSADGNSLVAVASGGGIWTLQSVTLPQLNISASNGNLALSWTVPSTNFVLQQSADLVSWTDVTNTPTLNLTTLQNQVFLAPASGMFFRLESQ